MKEKHGCCDHGHSHGEDIVGKLKIVCLISGAVLLVVGIIIESLWEINEYITLGIFIVAFLALGVDIVWRAIKGMLSGEFFDENFLMSIATIGAFIIGEYSEAVAVMLFYQVGELFQELAVRSSKKSIAKLMDIRPDFANISKNGEIVKVSPDTVAIGELIIVKPGERIPLDGVVVDGESLLDTAALTGESVPRKAKIGDIVLSGSVNQSGVLTIRVTQTFGESTVSKIIDLVENATEKKAPTENFITKFAKVYTPIVVGLATLIAILPPLLFGEIWADWIHRGLIFLVISCPCALVISIPLGFFGGIGGAAKKGVLVKGSNYLEALNSLEALVFDKTGTLTKGVFKVTAIEPTNGYTREQLLGMAAQAESLSNHPIALSILREYGTEVDKNKLSEYTEIAGHGISVKIDGKIILAGNTKLMIESGIDWVESTVVGTKVYISVDGIFVGSIVIADEIKEDSKLAISTLKAKGIKEIVMLTGDNKEIADAVASELGIEKVYSGLLPQDKVDKVKYLKSQTKGKLAFVGDGINDAPVLALSDIGIAMGGLGSDAAIEASDIVLMTDEPIKLAIAIEIAKFTKRIVWQNIIFALVVKVAFLGLGAFGIATMWEAVFADVGVALVAVLNALRVMRKHVVKKGGRLT